MSKISAALGSVTFSSGQTLLVNEGDKIILVGPNNSGKSRTLREIEQVAREGDGSRSIVVKDIKIIKKGNSEDLKEFLDESAAYKNSYYNYRDWVIHENSVKNWDKNYLRGEILGGFLKRIDAKTRLSICDQQSSIGPHDQMSRPQHVLFQDTPLMERISTLFKRAFSHDLMFDYRGGSVMPIHVGNKPSHEYSDRVGEEYVAAVRSNPLLDQQGDGMKSFAGILFETIAVHRDITLLDEPEAFLHPPQMRRLGEILASEMDGQLVVATHSSDIMRGFLEGTKGNVRVLRIRREGAMNFVSEAGPDVIKELWSRPELKYSNALESIFHEQAILCEDDSDCRLFNAVADSVAPTNGEAWQDTAYIPVGGKHGVRKVAAVLRKIGVPIKAVFDIDFLSDEDLVKETVGAFGGEWNDHKALWKQVDAAVRSGVRPKTPKEIARELVELLDNWDDGRLPRSKITEMMKQTSAWNMVKKLGENGIPRGEARKNFEKLLRGLREIGIYVVPVGEIESFYPEMGKHGPQFVHELLSTVSLDSEKLKSLRDFTTLVHSGAHAPMPHDCTKEEVAA
ncbi:ATP-dependent nuclease [Nitratireductor sp. CH_MIT9313-5]|uniref:ATP-dependent nuclease n=1 Tax=Nitratireductor sp. CH_MIT9313-5 TaxID=3107764 RepID=UPI00300A54B3